MNTKKFLAILMVLAMLLCIPVTASAAEGYTASLNVNWWDYSTQTITGAGTYTLTADLNWDGGEVQYAAITIPDAYSAMSGCSAAMTVSLGDQVLYDGGVSLNAQWVDDGTGNYVQSNNCYIELYASWNGTNLVESIPTGGILTVTLNITGELNNGGSQETPEETASTYVVAGYAGLCGSEWNGTDPANLMSDEDGDGIYTITYYGVPAGYYEFKVVENGENWYGDSNWNNVVLNLGAECDVTISFDTATCTVSTAVSGGEVVDDGTKYIVAGVSELCGSYWDPSDAANLMSDEDGDGVYTITYCGVEPGNYEYKVVANLPDGTLSWLCNDGWSNEVVSVEETCDVTICYDKLTGRISAVGSGVNTEKTIANCILAGQAALCGSDWDVSDLNNEMLDEDGDGIYTITYYNVAPGWYEFKVVENLSNGTRNWLTNDPAGNNMHVNLTWYTHITVSYDSNTGDIIVTKTAKEYTAALCFGDADWWPSCSVDYPPVTCQVDGEGNYTLTWDVANTCWASTEGMSVFYIDILNAYAEINANTVVTNVSVKADGEEVAVNMGNVKVYDSEGSYRIELYNMYGGSASAVDTGMVISDTLIVTFTLGSGNPGTGDSTDLMVLCGAMLVSAMGVVALVVSRKKFI